MTLLAIDIMSIVIPTALLVALGAVSAIILVVLSKKFEVKQNPKIEEVRSCLAGANCGACGFAGCQQFAEALVKGEAALASCSATSVENKLKIAAALGSGEGGIEETVAVVCCNGGNDSKQKYEYQGYETCNTSVLLAGGNKVCASGCLGLCTCGSACANSGISVGPNGFAVIDRKKCTGCGACIKACPKKLIRKIPKTAPVFVACSSNCRGKEVREVCSKGCIACGICAKNCQSGAITMVNNLPSIDYSKCIGCFTCVSKCPTKAIRKVI